ncbi:MAG: isoleucine--tRNA ligase [Crocinitomicaceae bacterium]|nr:isoleucine--tRNA ligase [Crocinitomicaceae bacterium]|tara:strand:+ start:3526 stop:6897 length:3372 start_codon:yes stop_codon:yes gene_type:complete
MAKGFPERGSLHLSRTAKEMLDVWKKEKTFQASIDLRSEDKPYVFYEGPPSANGMPGIHHVMGRTIKDIFCRFATLNGKRVERKAGWDTHGLPVELGVEKELGITKEDIGTKITVEEYNQACRKAVMKYTSVWNNLTRQMGYWVDMESPYVTYENKYIESVWWLLGQLYKKNLIYKGYTIQPYSPMAGTGLSSHELNQPGTYRDVKDTTIVAQFRVTSEGATTVRGFCSDDSDLPIDLLAWTTTPWTLPSNTALTVGNNIDYAIVKTTNRYTEEPCIVVLAEALIEKQFDKKAPQHEVIGRCKGSDLVGVTYHQLIDWAQPMEEPEEAFRVIPGSFVTTEDGTGIVHTAPTFGADDALVAKEAGVPPMLVDDGNGHGVPLVDLQGRLREGYGPFAGFYVKNEYYPAGEAPEKSLDVEIAIDLKTRGQAFKVEKYQHSYPHCWRTDKPILYYPLDSWFIKATAMKDRMAQLNKTINWKPESTGIGRFGKWLENLNDWNLSRSRFWGIPIPIWRTDDGLEERCISSVEELSDACREAVSSGLMGTNPLDKFKAGDMSEENYNTFDLHKHVVDDIVLKSSNGEPMRRETDLIDVWFDSGSMPYAQWHYPFENKEKVDFGGAYPADFIAEGVDQTRGWFYTLHAISTMVFDKVAYKNVVSNGLVLDKHGVKMSKRLNNAIDPFTTLDQYGADATRWYMISNAQPWDNLKFDLDGVGEVTRKFFGTLHNTYNFFALYANIDGYTGLEEELAYENRPEIDRWILSRMHTIAGEMHSAFEDLETTKAARLLQNFVTDELSNWYVRLNRQRFWKGDLNEDKISAYQTLATCLKTCAILGSPIAPFFMDRLYRDINEGLGVNRDGAENSVHLADFPIADKSIVDKELEKRMELARKLSSQVLSLRKREMIRVRQPLRKIMVPMLDDANAERLAAVEDLIRTEVNVKEVQVIRDGGGIVKSIKPDFKALGPRYGKRMKAIASAVKGLDSEDAEKLEAESKLILSPADGLGDVELLLSDVTISTEDIPGWLVSSEGGLTVALDITIDDELMAEGLSRELVNRVQNLRKDSGLEVVDRITLIIDANDELKGRLVENLDYIRTQTLAEQVKWQEDAGATEIELDENNIARVQVVKY